MSALGYAVKLGTAAQRCCDVQSYIILAVPIKIRMYNAQFVKTIMRKNIIEKEVGKGLSNAVNYVQAY